MLLHPDDQFTMDGYLSMLVGQRVPHRTYHPSPLERQEWERLLRTNRALARNAFSVTEALAVVRSPQWAWPADLYQPLCARPPAQVPAPMS